MTEDMPPAAPIRDPRLDRRVRFDERSRQYRAVDRLPRRAAQRGPRSYTWSCPVWLDQGQEGACTGFSTAQAVAARPRPKPGVTNADGELYYRRARQLDDWPGEDYDGSSVLGAMLAAKEFGDVESFDWVFGGAEELAAVVGWICPAVLGIDWLAGMAQTDERGLISATGGVLGGHAILCNGVNVKARTFRLHNSWGADWGVSGDAFISWSDMDLLLARQGEAAVPHKPLHRRKATT